MSSNDNMQMEFAIQPGINDFDDLAEDYEVSKTENFEDEIIQNQTAVTYLAPDGTDQSKVNDLSVENASYSSKKPELSITVDNTGKNEGKTEKAKTTLPDKSVYFHDSNSLEAEERPKKKMLKPILKSVTIKDDGGIDNVLMSNTIQALEQDLLEETNDGHDLQREINEISVEVGKDSESEEEQSDECESKSELEYHVERLKSTGKIEKVALIDFSGSILIRSVGMDINITDAESVLHVLSNPDTSLVKIRIGKQEFVCFKNSAISFVGRAENDFLHVRSCSDFIVICLSDPSSPGSCIYEVSRFVKHYYRTSFVSTNEFESALV